MSGIKSILNGLFHAHERISYRRLLAFGAACAMLWAGKLDSEQWCWVAIAFIAGEAAPKILGAVKG